MGSPPICLALLRQGDGPAHCTALSPYPLWIQAALYPFGGVRLQLAEPPGGGSTSHPSLMVSHKKSPQVERKEVGLRIHGVATALSKFLPSLSLFYTLFFKS